MIITYCALNHTTLNNVNFYPEYTLKHQIFDLEKLKCKHVTLKKL